MRWRPTAFRSCIVATTPRPAVSFRPTLRHCFKLSPRLWSPLAAVQMLAVCPVLCVNSTVAALTVRSILQASASTLSVQLHKCIVLSLFVHTLVFLPLVCKGPFTEKHCHLQLSRSVSPSLIHMYLPFQKKKKKKKRVYQRKLSYRHLQSF